jgi:hypothetical protein
VDPNEFGGELIERTAGRRRCQGEASVLHFYGVNRAVAVTIGSVKEFQPLRSYCPLRL